MNVDDMVKNYVRLRDHKKLANDEFAKSMEPINQAMEKLENQMLDKLNTDSSESIRTEHGTVYRTTHESASVKDRDAFLDFVLKKKQLEALDVRANKTFVKEYMTAHGPIPGVEMSSMQKIGVRRA